MNGFFHALAFLTRFPVPRSLSPEAWAQSAAWYPLVGVVIGLFTAVLAWGSLWLFPPLLASALVLAGWAWVTGGLHADGWMDTADALGSSRSRERMLEIMKDSRTGAMGVLAGVMLFAVKLAALYAMFTLADSQTRFALLLVPPVLARTGLVLAIACYPYLERDGKGMASGLKEGLTPGRRWAAWLGGASAVFIVGGPVFALIVLVLWLLVSAWFNRHIVKRLGGLTGDTYGALVELTEAVLLAFAAAYLHQGGEVGWFD